MELFLGSSAFISGIMLMYSWARWGPISIIREISIMLTSVMLTGGGTFVVIGSTIGLDTYTFMENLWLLVVTLFVAITLTIAENCGESHNEEKRWPHE